MSVIDRYGNTSSASIPLALVDAVDAGRVAPGSVVLLTGFGAGMLGPASGPAIRYHVEHTWPDAVDVRFATQPSPLGTVDAVLSASDYVGAAPYGVGNADDIYGRDGCALLAEHLRAGGDANALVGYRLADAVIGFSPVTRGICRVADDGRLLGVDERRQVWATAEGEFVAGDGREPAVLSPDARVSMNLWGFTAAFHRNPAGRHGCRRRGVRGGGRSCCPRRSLSSLGAAVLHRCCAADGRCVGVTHPDDLSLVPG